MQTGLRTEIKRMLGCVSVGQEICKHERFLELSKGRLEYCDWTEQGRHVNTTFYTIRESITQVPLLDIYPDYGCAVICKLDHTTSTISPKGFIKLVREMLAKIFPTMIVFSEQGVMTLEGLNKLCDILTNDAECDKRPFFNKVYFMSVWDININSLWDKCDTVASKEAFLEFFDFRI